MIRVGRRYRFSASHRLHSAQLSAEENRELYGKCNNPFGHGHDYILEVVLEGEPDASTGLLAPLKRLDDYVRHRVLADFDHKYLNEQVPVFSGTPATTENVAREIRRRLEDGWESVFPLSPSLKMIRIFETRRNIVELDR